MTNEERSQLGRGRTSRVWLPGFYPCVFVLCILFLATLLGGCVAPGPITDRMICGEHVYYHPDDLRPCNGGTEGCTRRAPGELSFHIYFLSSESALLGHEEQHICGMRHTEPWVTVAGKVCAVVTEGGDTPWRRGDTMCRVDAGPPIKILDPRVAAIAKEIAKCPN